ELVANPVELTLPDVCLSPEAVELRPLFNRGVLDTGEFGCLVGYREVAFLFFRNPFLKGLGVLPCVGGNLLCLMRVSAQKEIFVEAKVDPVDPVPIHDVPHPGIPVELGFDRHMMPVAVLIALDG